MLGSDYLPMFQKYLFDCSRGEYEFYSQAFYDFVKDEKHFVELMWWCFSKHQTVDKETIKEWVKDNTEEAIEWFTRFSNDSNSKKN